MRSIVALCFILSGPSALPIYGIDVTTRWSETGESIYQSGFVQGMEKDGAGGARIFGLNLIENDAPGSGKSERGVSEDPIYGEFRARKILQLEDPRASRGYLVLFTANESPKYSLTFSLNGYVGEVSKTNRETYRWVEVPTDMLRKGDNVIDLYCPQAKSGEEGWILYLARAEEFEEGGGDPSNAGETSYKSFDGGKNWERSPFGPEKKDRCEYSVRLSLERYLPSGWIETPVLDLWKGESTDFIIPLRQVNKLQIRMKSEVPEETQVDYFLRTGFGPSPHAEGWEPYQKIGSGELAEFSFDEQAFNRRFIQLRAELSTSNPLVSPTFQGAEFETELLQQVPYAENIRVVECQNDPIRYSSLDWKWEDWDRPEFEEIRERENLDEVLAGSRTDFDAQVKLLDHATKRWDNSRPTPEYPGWDALSILDRIEYAGGGGMCIQLNNALAGFFQAYGWQARHANIVSHEVCEVWNDEFGKWIYMDASTVNHYMADPDTGEPLSLLELHNLYLENFFPGKTIDWMNDDMSIRPIEKDSPVRRGSLSHGKYHFDGFNLAAFVRMIPRNNWHAEPCPRPVAHGCVWWPWDGYINWYDEQTPPKKQYSKHTDRPQDMWPDLNKVYVRATSGLGNDRIYLHFETYTPNFDRFEVNPDDTGWKEVPERWAWILQSGRNTLQVRAVSEAGVGGKPSVIALNHVDSTWGR